jgi:hypothetical protein
MKAWDDLVNNKDKTLYTTRDSEYYIDHGVKIERFDDGRIEVKNMMTHGEMFEDVDENILTIFNDEGWIPGCMNLNIQVYNDKLQRLNDLIRTSISNNNDKFLETLRNRRKVIQKKINIYRNRLTKIY